MSFRGAKGNFRRLPAARAVLVWGLVSFALAQAACGVVVDRWCPEIRHPEYGRKLALLSRQATAHQGQPLFLALGTSRTVFGFCASADEDAAAWQFNFGLTGVGPVQQLICFRRLLAAGVRPEQVLIELHPAFLHQTPDWCEARAVDVRKLNWRDFVVMRRHAFEPHDLTWRWLMSCLSPWYSYRVELLARSAPSWLDEASRRDERMLVATDDCGWSRYPVRPANEHERRRLGRLCAELYSQPLHEFEISEAPRRAIGELLDLCGNERIAAALVLMPEGKPFRQRYAQTALTRLDEYLTELRRKYSIEVFDCRRWCDDEMFCDGQHLLPEGAREFTARLRREGLRPWLAAMGKANSELAARPNARRE